MAKVVTVAQMVAIEKKANESGLTYDLMMENAGKSVAERLLRTWPEIPDWLVLIIVGPGNNGGDGLVAGHYLFREGVDVVYYLLKEREENDPNFDRVVKDGAEIKLAEEDKGYHTLIQLIDKSDVVIDALLGTGFKLPLRGGAQKLLNVTKQRISQRRQKCLVVAVDCPSGIDCDTGEVAKETLHADITITLAAGKPGLIQAPGADYVGRLFWGDIGMEDESELKDIKHEVMEPAQAQMMLPVRPMDAHKGTFGRILVIAGSINYPGAVALAAMGAYRSGAGLVTLAVPEPIYQPLVSLIPEATWIILPHDQGVITSAAVDVLDKHIDNVDTLLIGPGFGLERESESFLTRFFRLEDIGEKIGFVTSEELRSSRNLPPLVIDADGLKLLARIDQWHTSIPKHSILTPHPGELRVMTGLTMDEIQKDRVATAGQWAKTWGHIVILKGARTVIAHPDGRNIIIPIATPALAKAGTGDVLAGVIVGLLGQGMEPFNAAALGAYVHARAGQLASEMYQTATSVLASDVADSLSEVFAELEASS